MIDSCTSGQIDRKRPTLVESQAAAKPGVQDTVSCPESPRPALREAEAEITASALRTSLA